MPRPSHNKFVSISSTLGLDQSSGRDYHSGTFRWHAECCVA